MSKIKSSSKAEISKILANLLKEKQIQWDKIKSVIQKYPNSILDNLLRQGLKRACLDPSVCQICLKLLLKKTHLTCSQRVRYALLAVRCHNLLALETIIYDDVSVLYHTIPYVDRDEDGIDIGIDGGTTLLHRICAAHGWNNEVMFVLKETLENTNDGQYPHEGMYEGGHVGGKNFETPLVLALQAGAELDDIVEHMRREYPFHFEKKICRLPEIIAEYCWDMSLFCDLLGTYPSLLNSSHPKDNSTPLHFACSYQHEGMIEILLHEYLKLEGKRVTFKKRLLALDEEGLSPLGHLVINVGDRDDGNVWRCINLCANFFSDSIKNFPLLHYICEYMLDIIAHKKVKRMKVIRQLMDRLQSDLCHIDVDGKTPLSILITKMVNYQDEKTYLFSIQILEYILEEEVSAASTQDSFGQLPLHVACMHGMSWNRGLEKIVEANVAALEIYDPVSNLAPFAAIAAASDHLESVYQLLRKHPSVL